MRPIQLTMIAFGPYKDKEIIKFSDLKDHSLFVIAGNTGAGKTTIFDAICFALYGSASGQDRDHHSMLRSHFADPNTHTAVELIFTIHGRTYRVLRQLAHKKPGNKTPTGENYEFYEIINDVEVSVVDRQIVSKINAKIEEILGLTENQFKQIVMLPQGEFLKLLTSETENKEAILRRLFKTDHYQRLSELLRERKNAVDEQFQQEKLACEQLIEHIRATLPERDGSQLFLTLNAKHYNEQQVIAGLAEEKDYYLEKATKDEKAYRQASQAYDAKQRELLKAESLNKKFNDLAEKEKLLTELHNKEPLIVDQERKLAAAKQAEKIKPYDEQYKRTVEEKQAQQKYVQQLIQRENEVEKKLQKAQEIFATEKARESLRDDERKALDRLKEHLPFVRVLNDRQASVAKLRKQVGQQEKFLSELDKKVEKKQTEHAATTEKIRQDELALNNFSKKQQELATVKESLVAIENYEMAEQILLQTKEIAARQEATYKQLQTKYKATEEKWLSHQAHHLAVHLHDGEPCPVCGSLEHPKLAAADKGEISRAELMATKKQLDEAESVYHQQVALLKTYETQKDQTKQALIDLAIKQEEKAEKKQALQSKKTTLEMMIKTLIDKEKNLRKLRAKAEKETNVLQQLQTERDKERTEYQAKQTKLKEAEAVLENELERIPEDVRELTTLEKQIEQKEAKVAQLIKNWEKAEQALQIARDEMTKLSTESKVAQTRLTELKKQANESEQVFLKALEEGKFSTPEKYYTAILDQSEQERINEQLTNYRQKMQLTLEQVRLLQKELMDKKQVNLDNLKRQVRSLKEMTEKALQTQQQSKSLHKEADRLRSLLTKTTARAKEREKELNQVAELHNVTRGQNELRLSFERFLQIEYLEQIIHAANQRLQHLSNGQYWLQRSDRQESHGRQSGLAFDVFDEYTGKLRDVKTLSGGEKFNASLCLALGMSDVIQSFQGNISIETMFIDEGFGTLDEETLNKSVETLIDLQASGRMIGVISHVQQLKTIFPAILEVTKTKDGYSQTKFIVS